MVQFDIGPANALVEGHTPANGACEHDHYSRFLDLPVLDPQDLDARTDRPLPRGLRGLQGQVAVYRRMRRTKTRRERLLDRALLFGITSVLQLDPGLEEGLDLLRKQWCAEPSVHGWKSTRISE